MRRIHPILAAALLAAVTTQAQSVPIASDSPGGSRNLSSEGTSFTHTLTPGGSWDPERDQLLLSLNFDVSRNAAALNDTISLFVGGVRIASGQAAGFGVTNLDVTDYFDFTTGTITYELFRGVRYGGGSIRLRSSTLNLVSASSSPELGLATVSPGDAARSIPEPGPLALLGLGLLGLAGMGWGRP